MSKKNIRNIALFAHVDAGKTTVSEQFLYRSGKIKSPGSVDKGNSQADCLEVEKERGITVNSTILTFLWNDIQINLIDTPGHVDFSSETEKSIYAIDSAVVIVSAQEGVQAQTENMIELLKKHNKPFLIFINKIDRMGASSESILLELEKDLGLRLFPLQKSLKEGEDDFSIDSVWTKERYLEQTDLIEKLVEYDEKLLDLYFKEEILEWEILDDLLKKIISKEEIIPVLLGSAKKAIGIMELLNAVTRYLPNPVQKSDDLLGIVFKTDHQKGEGKMSAVRLFGGEIKARDIVINASKEDESKITLIKDTNIQKQSIVQIFQSGEIAWVQGLKWSEPGDYLGFLPEDKIEKERNIVLLTVKILLDKKSDSNALIEAMVILNNEDPNLNFEYLKEDQEFNINIRGKIQEEIIQSLLWSRFGIAVHFSEPTVIYKETPTVVCEGFVRYWLPKPCWAIMKFRIEPAERNSGITYSSVVGVNDIKSRYQNDVEKAIPQTLKQGILGWQVDDVRITLIEGEDHEAHTKSNDFTIATPMGIMEGLSKSESTLLEPILSFKISAPESFLGLLVSELTKRRAEIKTHMIEQGNCKLYGLFPLSESLDFPIKLSSITSGRGKIRTQFFTYQACDLSLGKVRKYKGINPLDTAKYILKARKALA